MFKDDLAEFIEKEKEPATMELVYYIFFEKGIDYHRFNELPIPYILSILSTNKYIKKKEEESMKDNSKGKGVL